MNENHTICYPHRAIISLSLLLLRRKRNNPLVPRIYIFVFFLKLVEILPSLGHNTAKNTEKIRCQSKKS